MKLFIILDHDLSIISNELHLRVCTFKDGVTLYHLAGKAFLVTSSKTLQITCITKSSFDPLNEIIFKIIDLDKYFLYYCYIKLINLILIRLYKSNYYC